MTFVDTAGTMPFINTEHTCPPRKVPKSRAREWACEQCRREYYRDYRRRTPRSDNTRAAHLRRTYGMTEAQYDAMLAEQGGACAVCGATKPSGPSLHFGRWCIDHDHATGRVRGLLCNTCNLALGAVKDSPEMLDALAAYVRRSREQRG